MNNFLILLNHDKSIDMTCILIKTELGNINAKLYDEEVPITTRNFLNYVDAKLYDGTKFFRTTRSDNQPTIDQPNAPNIEIIQGGEVDASNEFPPIEHETTAKTGIKHK